MQSISKLLLLIITKGWIGNNKAMPKHHIQLGAYRYMYAHVWTSSNSFPLHASVVSSWWKEADQGDQLSVEGNMRSQAKTPVTIMCTHIYIYVCTCLSIFSLLLLWPQVDKLHISHVLGGWNQTETSSMIMQMPMHECTYRCESRAQSSICFSCHLKLPRGSKPRGAKMYFSR